MEDAGLLNSEREGNKKLFFANKLHPLFSEIHNIIIKETGIHKVIEKVIDRLGNLECVYLTGDLARGRDSQVIDLILVGDDIDREYLIRKVEQAEEISKRKVRYLVLGTEESKEYLSNLQPVELLPLWTCDDKKVEKS